MSIVTRTGDEGTTGLMYNRRVSKSHPRVEACGSVDELNAALGMARAFSPQKFIQDILLATQKDLVILMGELATELDDLPRYRADGFSLVSREHSLRLEDCVREIEAQAVTYKGWATPGATTSSAAIDLARATCRRAERRVCALRDAGQIQNPEVIIYLNRLADLLWLLARWSEVNAPPGTD